MPPAEYPREQIEDIVILLHEKGIKLAD